MQVNFILNGAHRTFDVQPGEFLLETLRNSNILSVKDGCNESTCGACTVLIDGKPILSCSFLSMRAEGHEILTVDGLQDEVAKISALFSDEGADQCGFCNPGLALTTYSLKRELKNPTDEEIKQYLVGNLCRCSGYQSQFKAIKRYVRDEQ
ncbi:MAG: 2Fe-2S iron-sulfur cluster-binding protein [Bacilli bacterium]|jgi:carbon-monoxide dehydrogenase small subunit|nr:2Fe-2S iron-sulfur cluster-binding protein [Bacilli bacterium]